MTLMRTFPTETAGLSHAVPTERVDLADGHAFDLHIGPIAKQLGDSTLRMLAYNGSIPGPTLWVQQGSELTIHAHNGGDLETTVHWHGLRLENQFDGTTETEAPMRIGDSFSYRLQFPDPGVYWYHPHIREDYGQELGLYGNIVVVPSDPTYWPAAHREHTLTLDDLLPEGDRVAPFSTEESNYTAMGRFGNVLLVQGQTDVALTAHRGEVVRFYLTNTANTRVFNIAFRGARMKRVGGDSGRVERKEFVESLIIAPSERVVIDVRFDDAGSVELEHRTPKHTYHLGTVRVLEQPAELDLRTEFAQLRTNSELVAARGRIHSSLEAAPTKTLALVAEMNLDDSSESAYACPMHPEIRSDHADRCPKCHMKLVPTRLVDDADGADHHHTHHHGNAPTSDGIEWEDDMVAVNRSASSSMKTRFASIKTCCATSLRTIERRRPFADSSP